MFRTKCGCLVLLILGILVSVSPAALAGVELTASGSTFIFPIESKWANIYAKVDPDLRINYQPNGSGAGIGQLLQGLTDFAGSDAPLTDKQLDDAPGNVLHFPAALGADVVAYNLPEIAPSRLKLTGPVIADIFRGKISKWNDEKIANLNPELKLPAKDILTIYRSDGSGTTFIFVDYLSKVSPDWEKEIGRGTTVKWPVGTSAPGNQGVTDMLSHTPGAISYLRTHVRRSGKTSLCAGAECGRTMDRSGPKEHYISRRQLHDQVSRRLSKLHNQCTRGRRLSNFLIHLFLSLLQTKGSKER